MIPGIEDARSAALLAFLLSFSAAAWGSQAVTLRGRVVDQASGEGLASAEVRVSQPQASEMAADLETDAEGRFGPVPLAEGAYRLEVLKSGFLPTRAVVRGGGTVDVPLIRLGSIGGAVSDAAGQPMRDAKVWAMTRRDGAWEPFERAVRTDESGEYRLAGLPPGDYAIGFDGSLYPETARPRVFEIRKGEEFTRVDLVGRGGARHAVSGQVSGAAEGARFQISLARTDAGAMAIANDLSDGTGRFRFGCVPDGDYEALVSGPVSGRASEGSVLGSGAVYGRARISVAAQDAAGVQIAVGPPASAAFVLNKSGDSKGCAPSAQVRLIPLEDWQVARRFEAEVSFVQPRAVPGLPPGRYAVSVAGLGDGCFAQDPGD